MTDIKLDKIEYSFNVTLDDETFNEFHIIMSICKTLLKREGQNVKGEQSDAMYRYIETIDLIEEKLYNLTGY